jgi:putative transposase
VVRDNHAVYVEDLCVKGLGRTRLAKSVHDAGWAAFLAMLEYKARRYGRRFGKVGRFQPTSQVCSACGIKDGPKPLWIRTWTCRACGTTHDRDHNAAKNIAALGRREALNACGDGGRPGSPRRLSVKQEPTGAPHERRCPESPALQSGKDVKS